MRRRSVDLTLKHWDLSQRPDGTVRPARPAAAGGDFHEGAAPCGLKASTRRIVTPYRPDFSLDEDALDRVVEQLIAAGVHGIIVAGTTGEYYAQTARRSASALMPMVADLIGGRVPMIVGTGAMRTEDSIDYAKAAVSVGADALLVATPPYAYPTGREIALHALAIDRAANLPVMLYNYPGRMSVNMDAECLDRLGRSPNFCAIKESSGDIEPPAHAGPRLSAYPAGLRHGRPGAGVLCLGRAVLGLRRVELRA